MKFPRLDEARVLFIVKKKHDICGVSTVGGGCYAIA